VIDFLSFENKDFVYDHVRKFPFERHNVFCSANDFPRWVKRFGESTTSCIELHTVRGQNVCLIGTDTFVYKLHRLQGAEFSNDRMLGRLLREGVPCTHVSLIAAGRCAQTTHFLCDSVDVRTTAHYDCIADHVEIISQKSSWVKGTDKTVFSFWWKKYSADWNCPVVNFRAGDFFDVTHPKDFDWPLLKKRLQASPATREFLKQVHTDTIIRTIAKCIAEQSFLKTGRRVNADKMYTWLLWGFFTTVWNGLDDQSPPCFKKFTHPTDGRCWIDTSYDEETQTHRHDYYIDGVKDKYLSFSSFMSGVKPFPSRLASFNSARGRANQAREVPLTQAEILRSWDKNRDNGSDMHDFFEVFVKEQYLPSYLTTPNVKLVNEWDVFVSNPDREAKVAYLKEECDHYRKFLHELDVLGVVIFAAELILFDTVEADIKQNKMCGMADLVMIYPPRENKPPVIVVSDYKRIEWEGKLAFSAKTSVERMVASYQSKGLHNTHELRKIGERLLQERHIKYTMQLALYTRMMSRLWKIPLRLFRSCLISIHPDNCGPIYCSNIAELAHSGQLLLSHLKAYEYWDQTLQQSAIGQCRELGKLYEEDRERCLQGLKSTQDFCDQCIFKDKEETPAYKKQRENCRYKAVMDLADATCVFFGNALVEAGDNPFEEKYI